jgi:predicted transcriptional regulator
VWRGRPRPRACEMKDCIDELTCNIKYDKVTAMRESITFTISLPPAMAKEVERAMRVEHRTRSELVREALRVYLSARLIPTELPTAAEARSYRRGMDAYNRGDAVTLQEYLNGMDRRPRRTRKKVS